MDLLTSTFVVHLGVFLSYFLAKELKVITLDFISDLQLQEVYKEIAVCQLKGALSHDICHSRLNKGG